MVPDDFAAVLLRAKALQAFQLGAVTGKLCLLHEPKMNDLDVIRDPSGNHVVQKHHTLC